MNTQKTFSLLANKRDITGKKVKKIRQKGLVPAVLYGRDIKPENISIEKIGFVKIFNEAGTSSLIDLNIDHQKPIKVLSHEPQRDPVSGEPIHVDFYKVKMDEKIKTEIPLSFTGESEAVEQLEGSLVTNKDAIEVECLPTDLVSEIEVNISSLKTFEDTIKISDLKIPANIEILHDQDEIIALVEEPRSEEELAELEEKSAEEEEKEALEKMGAETEAENREAKEGEAGEEKEDSEQSAPTEPDNKEK